MPKEEECCTNCAGCKTPGRDMMVICGEGDIVPADYWCPYYSRRHDMEETA